jgi:hypothetical protein
VIAAFVVAGVWAASQDTLVTAKPSQHLTAWLYLGIASAIAVFTLLVGWTIRGHWSGALVDPKRQRMSLSRLQMLLWSALVLASYMTAVMINLAHRNAANTTAIDALAVAIPGELLVAMGLSVGSLVGARVVLNRKETEHGTVTSALPPDTITDTGAVEPTAPRSAVFRARGPRWLDLFEGDTAESRDAVDVGKLQMFFITIALVLGYGLVVADLFASSPATGISSLPALNDGFVALLAISHAGYLTAKVTS